MMRRQWKEVQTLYALGILLVVIGHSHSSDWNTFNHTLLKPLIYAIYTFHMPLFFAIAGFLFQNSPSQEEIGFLKWLKGKAMRLLVPYTFWTLISLLPKFYVEHHGFSGFTWLTPLESLFFPRLNVWGHLWFCPVLFLIYLLFGAIRSWTRRRYVLAVFLIELIISIIICLLPLPVIKFLGLTDIIQFSPSFVVGMGINMLLTQRDKVECQVSSVQMMLSCLLWLVSFIAVFCIQKVGLKIPDVIFAIWMLAVSWWLARCIPQMSLFTFLSKNVFTFYIFSWFFQSVIMLICDRLSLPWFATSITMFISGVLGPILVLLVYRICPFMHVAPVRIIVGMR